MSKTNTNSPAIETPLQAVTFGMLLALTAPSPDAQEKALEGLHGMAEALSKDEFDFAQRSADALAAALTSCHFGMSSYGACAAFYSEDELKAFLASQDGSRLATDKEINKYVFDKAATIKFKG